MSDHSGISNTLFLWPVYTMKLESSLLRNGKVRIMKVYSGLVLDPKFGVDWGGRIGI